MKNIRHKSFLLKIISVLMVMIIFAGITVKAEHNPYLLYQQILYFDDYDYIITHNIETYLLIGTDDTGNIEAAGTEDYLGQMADFLLLLVLDRTDNTYGFVQINRDTMTEVPFMDTEGNGEGTAFEQICISHWYGGTPEMGCNNTMYTVSDLLGGIYIDGYYSINMNDVAYLNSAVGGVEVTLEDDFSMVDPAMAKGTTLTLSDEQAVKFIRYRMNIGDGDNESRMRRHRQFMNDFKKKALQKMHDDKSFVTDVLNGLKERAVTNMPVNRWSVVANQIYKSDDLGILQYEGEVQENDTLDDGVIHAEFYADTQSIADVMAQLCAIDEDHIIYTGIIE